MSTELDLEGFYSKVRRILPEDFINLDREISEGEDIIGEMTNAEKKVFTLRVRTAAELQKEVYAPHVVQARVSRKLAISEACDRLLWFLIGERLEIANEDLKSVALRKNWKIVRVSEGDKEFGNLLREIQVGDSRIGPVGKVFEDSCIR